MKDQLKFLNLLQGYSSTSFLELRLHFLCLVLCNAFLDRRRCALDELLSLFQAKTSDVADSLDNSDLVSASVLQDNVKFSLLFSGRSSTSSRAGHTSSRTAPARYSRGLRRASPRLAPAIWLPTTIMARGVFMLPR